MQETEAQKPNRFPLRHANQLICDFCGDFGDGHPVQIPMQQGRTRHVFHFLPSSFGPLLCFQPPIGSAFTASSITPQSSRQSEQTSTVPRMRPTNEFQRAQQKLKTTEFCCSCFCFLCSKKQAARQEVVPFKT